MTRIAQMRWMVTLGLCLMLSAGCAHSRRSVSEPLGVSLWQLIATPDRYDGKRVRAVGFLRLEFEGNGLFLHEEDYKHGLLKNGLWVDESEDMRKNHAQLDRKYVLIEGTFNAK